MKLKYSALLSLLLVLLLAGCASNPPKTAAPTPDPMPKTSEPETPSPELVEPEPAQPEPVHPEPVQPEPVQPEPVQPEPAQPEPVQPEPVQPEPAQPEPVVTEPVEPEPAVTTRTIQGRVALVQNNKNRKPAEVGSTVVYFEPDTPKSTVLTPTNAVISTQNKRFTPDVLAVTVGSQVDFPNLDRILHNVFSVSPQSEFDLGLYSAGTTKSVTFDQPGIIYVHCNVHHAMQADILVLDTPHFTAVDQNGQYSLTGIEDLNGTLKFWHPQGNIVSITMDDSSAITGLDATIKITRPKVPKHTNKFGESYRPTRD